MFGSGTIINCLAIIGGTVVGLFLKKGLPDKIKDIIESAIAISVVIIGISGVLSNMLIIMPNGKLDRLYIMEMIGSLIIGGVIGAAIDIDGKVNRLGGYLSNKLTKGKESRFAKGFADASILYCVGAMAIVGALEDGLMGNPATLYAKAVLDGVMSIVLASTLGIGVGFSVIPVFIYQGGITLFSGFIKPFLTDAMLVQMSIVGSALILCIGLNMLKITNIKVANLLLATFMPIVFVLVTNII